MVLALIDIGTVTARLGIFICQNDHVELLKKESVICNLGEGVDATRMLLPEAKKRVIDTVSSFVVTARAMGAQFATCTLTSAARDAKNAKSLLDSLREMDLEPEIIPGEVEGKLTFLGVAQDYKGQRIAVLDSGGGSSELCVGSLTDDKLNIEQVHSYDIGARRVTDKFLGLDRISADNLRKAHIWIADTIKSVTFFNMADMLVGVGGTATSAISMNKRLSPYDSKQVHLACITASEMQKLEEKLASVDLEDRKHVVGLQPKRASVIVGGICTINEFMQVFGFKELHVSESDLLFGLAIALNSYLTCGNNVVEWISHSVRL